MKKSLIFIFSLVCMFLVSCSKEEKKQGPPPESSINLSELETRHDYYLPFAIVNDNSGISGAIMNGENTAFMPGDYIEFKETGFYELILQYKDTAKPNDTIFFTTKTEEREVSEWGIPAWIPKPYTSVPLGSESIEIYYPRRFNDLVNIPFIFFIKESGKIKGVYTSCNHPVSSTAFNIKQGAGSVNINGELLSPDVTFIIGGRQVTLSLTRLKEPDLVLSGIVTSQLDVPANSYVKIEGNLEISAGGSLTIHEGTIILADEAADITVKGPIFFYGSVGNPVFMSCSVSDKFWGGFIANVPAGSIEARYTIFCQSGYHDTEGYQWGHAGRQALFYTENSTLKLDHCFITDHIGQVFYPQNSVLNLSNILVQRVKTGGQINTSDLTINNSFFTDFPDESEDFRDNDNDALYLNGSDAVISSTIFMFAKDDGLDSGGSTGGEIIVSDCRFEACFHEGAALSSVSPAVKNHTFTGCVFTNCGQGLELGYSSPNHSVTADNCSFLNNGIGIRYGDNYDWSDVDGKMLITNSESLDNVKDVWNMVRKSWSPELQNLNFENTFVSKFCPQYPDLPLKNQ